MYENERQSYFCFPLVGIKLNGNQNENIVYINVKQIHADGWVYYMKLLTLI